MFRPNFTKVDLDGDVLNVHGVSDPDDPPMEIRIYLAQEGEVADDRPDFVDGTILEVSNIWELPLPAKGFKRGAAVAVGIEIRTEPFMTAIWTEPVMIR